LYLVAKVEVIQHVEIIVLYVQVTAGSFDISSGFVVAQLNTPRVVEAINSANAISGRVVERDIIAEQKRIDTDAEIEPAWCGTCVRKGGLL